MKGASVGCGCASDHHHIHCVFCFTGREDFNTADCCARKSSLMVETIFRGVLWSTTDSVFQAGMLGEVTEAHEIVASPSFFLSEISGTENTGLTRVGAAFITASLRSCATNTPGPATKSAQGEMRLCLLMDFVSDFRIARPSLSQEVTLTAEECSVRRWCGSLGCSQHRGNQYLYCTRCSRSTFSQKTNY